MVAHAHNSSTFKNSFFCNSECFELKKSVENREFHYISCHVNSCHKYHGLWSCCGIGCYKTSS